VIIQTEDDNCRARLSFFLHNSVEVSRLLADIRSVG
jgi:hypothetical protein